MLHQKYELYILAVQISQLWYLTPIMKYGKICFQFLNYSMISKIGNQNQKCNATKIQVQHLSPTYNAVCLMEYTPTLLLLLVHLVVDVDSKIHVIFFRRSKTYSDYIIGNYYSKTILALSWKIVIR